MSDKKQAAATKPAKHESAYPVAEIAANARRLFGVNPDIATAALRRSHATSLTLSEARTIIRTFAEREVKD